MSWDSPEFVIVIVAMVMVTAIISTWIQSRARAKNSPTDSDVSHKALLIEQENEGLKSKISGLEERLTVLERIATDSSERTAREIEKLR